ncbi:MAG TPA: CDP-alcohol phosphatidyltransferase family protein [Candidatus Saccharimonadales bacterium]|nr:CDP-alcohol phosphatidyltransferase family protein [Candidatus Saccharimonadales bacterium]
MNEKVSGLDQIRLAVRKVMRVVARGLNTVSGGRLSPNFVTIQGLIAHVAIAIFIASDRLIIAGCLLVIFGLFDTLDGELARLQNKASAFGMLLDSITDRVKEIILYISIAYFIIADGRPFMAIWAVAACGVSLLTSYTNAWGDAVLSTVKTSEHTVNKTFRGGLLGFELRMVVLILGLLTNKIVLSIILITILGSITVIQRLMYLTSRLYHDKS